MALIYLCGVWLAGIFLGSILELPIAWLLAVPVAYLASRLARPRGNLWLMVGLGLATVMVGALYSSSGRQATGDSLQAYQGAGTVQLEGTVSASPETGNSGARIRLKVDRVRLGGDWRPASGTTLLFVPRYPAYQYGDVLLVSGKVEAPARFEGFDYPGYLANQGIYTVVNYPRIERVGGGAGSTPLEWLYRLRARAAASLDSALPEPQAALARAIVLGTRSNLSPELKDAFYRTGTTHVLAISGLHLSIVAGMLIGLGIWLFGRRHFIYIWLTLAVVWLYSILTGLHPPVLRAAIMASLFLGAELLGRQRSGMIALAFGAAIMVGLDPPVLRDVSFQLSFMAMAGLVLLFPRLRDSGRVMMERGVGEEGALPVVSRAVSDALALSLAATIAVWPLISHYFGNIALIGPIATLLLLPALPGIIVTGALSALLGMVWQPVGVLAGIVAWPFLGYMSAVVTLLSEVPLASLQLSPLPAGLVWAYYPAVGGVLWAGRHRATLLPAVRSIASSGLAFFSRLPPKWAIPPLLVMAILAWSAAATMPDDRLHVTVLDVGQGDAILVQKGNRQVLVDGGPSPAAISRSLGKRLPFWDRDIDLLVLTHPHADHLAGLIEVLARYRVAQVLVPDLAYNSPVNAEWLRRLDEKRPGRVVARAGQSIDLGDGIALRVLYAAESARPSREMDDNSLVLRLSYGNVSFLLTGDATDKVEQALVQSRANLASTVLKVAHHGSATSSTPAFLDVVDPAVAVVSVGADNRVSLPNPRVMARLEQRPGAVYRTDRDGSVEFITDGARLWVTTEIGVRPTR